MAKHALKHFAQRARKDTFFLGAALAAYQEARGWDERKLASFLGCGIVGLDRLASCRAPSLEPREFKVDVRTIAAFGGCNPERLAEVVREQAVSAALGGPASAASTKYLLAARDQKSKRPRKRKKHDPGHNKQ
jgi:hypothetical protein